MRSRKSTLALTLTIALSVMSCAAPKEAATQSRSERTEDTHLQQQDTRLLELYVRELVNRMVDERLRIETQIQTDTDETTEKVTEVFDTSQPTDSASGTPPLLSRTTESRRKNSRSDSRGTVEQTTKESMAASVETEAKGSEDSTAELEKQSEAKDESKSREKPKQSTALKIAGVVGGAVIALFFLWVILTVARAIKQILNNH